MAEMQIHLNGADRLVADGTTITQLLRELDLNQRQVAVERNQQVVPRAAHADTVLQESDCLEIVTLVGGG